MQDDARKHSIAEWVEMIRRAQRRRTAFLSWRRSLIAIVPAQFNRCLSMSLILRDPVGKAVRPRTRARSGSRKSPSRSASPGSGPTGRRRAGSAHMPVSVS